MSITCNTINDLYGQSEDKFRGLITQYLQNAFLNIHIYYYLTVKIDFEISYLNTYLAFAEFILKYIQYWYYLTIDSRSRENKMLELPRGCWYGLPISACCLQISLVRGRGLFYFEVCAILPCVDFRQIINYKGISNCFCTCPLNMLAGILH